MTFILLSALHEVAPDRPSGYLEEVMASGTVVTTPDGEFLDIPDETYDALAAKYSGKQPEKGPGTILHRALEAIGIKALPSCPCLKRKALMDAWGWDECQKPERLDEVVGWMEEEASLRGLLFIRSAARLALAAGLAAGARIYGGAESATTQDSQPARSTDHAASEVVAAEAGDRTEDMGRAERG